MLFWKYIRLPNDDELVSWKATHFISVFRLISGWVGALSVAVALFISPITIGVCKRKSTRLTAVIGGKYLYTFELDHHLCTHKIFILNFFYLYLSNNTNACTGLVTALGCLFTSFASQFHQLFFSYGNFLLVYEQHESIFNFLSHRFTW